jgi:hypothetical protein
MPARRKDEVTEMPEVRKKIPILGRETEVVDVPVAKATEPWNEYELEDGSVVRSKNVVTSILRIEGQHNPNDRLPIYLVLTSPVIQVVSSPEHLRKKV